MKKSVVARLFAAGIVAVMCLGSAAFGASDYLLTIDGVPGESQDVCHPGAIEIQGYSFDLTGPRRTAFVGGGGTGKVSLSDISFTKRMDKSSPNLMQACATGKHFPSAKLFVRKQGTEQQDFLQITLTDVMVSSYSQTGSQGDIPTESVSLNFTKIEFSFIFPNPAGGAPEVVKFSWDIKTNTR